jgi:hypothetical protein
MLYVILKYGHISYDSRMWGKKRENTEKETFEQAERNVKNFLKFYDNHKGGE